MTCYLLSLCTSPAKHNTVYSDVAIQKRALAVSLYQKRDTCKMHYVVMILVIATDIIQRQSAVTVDVLWL